LERVEQSKGISAGIHEAYNSGGQYKGDWWKKYFSK
jgi:hypothetical protein